jgi:hypothetical protein
MEFKQTKHQTPRGTMADAEQWNALFLLKKVSELRLTYQIRLLTFKAQSQKRKLIIRLPKGARQHSTLKEFIRSMDGLVRVEYV